MYNDDPKSGFFEKFLIKSGVAGGTSQARNILIVLTVIIFLLAFYLIKDYFLPNKENKVDFKTFMKMIHDNENQNKGL